MTLSSSRKAASVAVLWLFPALLLLPVLFYPLGLNQGIYVYIGDVIARGGMPYRDAFDTKGPALYYAYALFIQLLGARAIAVGALFFVVTLLGAQVAGVLAARAFGERARLPTAAIYALGMQSVSSWEGAPVGQNWLAEAEDLSSLFILLTIALLGSETAMRSRIRAFLGGMLLGLSFLTKPTTAVSALLVMAGAAIAHRKSARAPLPILIRQLGLGALGSAILVLATALFFVSKGALSDLWLATVRWNLEGYSSLSRSGFEPADLLRLADLFNRFHIRLTLIAIGGLWVLRRRISAPLVLVLAFLLGALIELVAQGRFWNYHWKPVIAALAILGGIGAARGLEGVVDAIHGTAAKRALAFLALVALPLVIASGSLRPYLRVWQHLGRAVLALEDFSELGRSMRDWAVTEPAIEEVSTFLSRQTGPEDQVMVFGFHTGLNVRSERRSPCRFIHAMPLLAESPLRAAWQDECYQRIAARPPAFIVATDGPLAGSYPMGLSRVLFSSLGLMSDFPALERLFRLEYVEVLRVERFRVFGRKRSGA